MSKPKIEVIPPRRKKELRLRSPRYYLALMDAVFEQACRGERSVVDAQRLTDMARAQLEAWANLKVLEMNNQDQPIDVAPGPEEAFRAPAVRAHRQKKVTAKRGTGRHGEQVDEVTVSITSNAEDKDSEDEAQIEALT